MDRESRGAAALLVTARSDAAGRYRCDHAWEQLRLQGIDAAVVDLLDPALEAALAGCRLAIFHRVGLDRRTERLYRRVSNGGGLAVYDTDDLVFDAGAALEVPHRRYGNDRVRAAWVREEALAQRRAVELADAVLVATDYLAEEVRKIGTPAWVHRNAFSRDMLRFSEEARAEVTGRNERPETRRKIVIGYASGTPTHDGDFLVAKPALVRLLQTHEHAELWLVGPVDPGDGWGTARDRIRRIGLVSWQHLPFVIAGFDVSIAPLESEKRFCRAKSEVKYIESGLAAVPVIASTGAGFDYAIRSGQNGLLASSTQDWVGALETLLRDGDNRRTMGERARADVLERYHPSKRGGELLRVLNDASRAVRGRSLWVEPGANDGTKELDERLRIRSSLLARASSSTRIGALPSGLPFADPAAPRLQFIRRGLYSLRYRGLRVFLMELWIGARGWWSGLLQLSPRS